MSLFNRLFILAIAFWSVVLVTAPASATTMEEISYNTCMQAHQRYDEQYTIFEQVEQETIRIRKETSVYSKAFKDQYRKQLREHHKLNSINNYVESVCKF